MKNRSKLFSVLLAALLLLSLAGCGASAKNQYSASPAAASGTYSIEEPAEYEMVADTASAAEAPIPMPSETSVGGGNGELPTAQDMSEKIIYNAEVTLETTAFDEAMERISAMVKEIGGYMESTSVSGNNYNSISRGYAGARSAYYTIRVPSARFGEFTGSLSDLGNVPYSRTYTKNITTEYYDVQSRLDAYRVQEKRLLEMLSIAETVDDMLSIQRELTDVQYEIDSLTGRLRYYDNKVGYSTVNLTVNEVREYTPEPTITLTYWERMSKGFKESMQDTGNFFKEFFLWFVTSLPWMIPLVVFIAAVVALIRRRTARNPEIAARRAARKEARAQRRAEKRALKAAGKKDGESKE